MNKANFKKLLAVPTRTYHEDIMVAHLCDYLKHEPVSVRVDEFKNVYVIKHDNDRPLPCVAAHIDSVQPLREVNIIETCGLLCAEDMEGHPVGFGADDKTGIQVCLELLHRFDHIALMLFAGEEYGCYGARHADPDFFKKVGYVIEYDCPSRNMVSYTCSGVRLFENGGEFITRALPVLRQHGSVLWQHHPYTDVMAVRNRFPISCLNLSSGYYNWHASNEFVCLSDVELAIEQGEELVQALDSVAYPCPQRLNENGPAIPIGPLRVPEANPAV